MLEAMACGVPVAAYPVAGPRDIICQGVNGATSESLAEAIVEAKKVSPVSVRAYAETKSWENVTKTFANALVAKLGGRDD